MELDRLCLELRRRTAWEAVDLGLPVLRRWAGPVYRVWFATFVPFTVAVFSLLWDRPWLALFLVWWLKPLFDRILLKVYAEALFDRPPRLRAVWRAIPGLLLHSRLPAGLLWGRFDMARSFHLPIWQLERQRGAAAGARRRLLDRKTRSTAVWLLFVCANVSAFLQVSIVLLLGWLWPGEAPPPFDWAALFRGEEVEQPWQAVISNLSFLIGESLVEPFYVAAGFTLYLNRRNDLEGWDIELGFRRLAERVRKDAAKPGVRSLLVWAWLGLVAGLAWPPGEAYAAAAAQPAAPLAGEAGEAKRAIRAVLEDPVFGRKVEDWEWRRRTSEPKAQGRSPSPRLFEWLRTLADWLAKGIKLLSFLGAAVLAALLAVLLYRHRDAWLVRRKDPRPLPETLFGLDLRPQSLPDDIAASARRHLAAGDPLLALSLLYRGALVALMHGARVEFRPGDTEGDCLARVQGRLDSGAEAYFSALLETWTHAAYAHEAPQAERVERLCAGWNGHFGRGAP